MKIYCEKCKKDITVQCNKAIEEYSVGNVECPYCHAKQKRYISEADVLLFFAINEVAYIILCFIAYGVISMIGFNLITIAVIILTMVLAYYASKALSSNIYDKAYLKKEWKNMVFDEDVEAIKKNCQWQFILFFAIVITFFTLDEGKIFFGLAMPAAAILSFLKLYLQLKYERNKFNETKK